MRHTLKSPNLRNGQQFHAVRVYEPSGFAEGGALSQLAEQTRRGGRGGDEVLLHINPEEFEFLKREWGEPSINPQTGLPEYGFFSKLKKALKFEGFNVKNILKDIGKNPERLLTGAVDPLGTKISNTMFGTDHDPVVNQLGGATEQRFADAEAEGLDTGLARDLHQTAGLVAGVWGGNALGNLASTGLGNVATGLESLGNANTLSPMVTTASGTAGHISPVVVQAGQTGANASNLLGTAANTAAGAARYGEGALSNLGKKAGNYAKNPKNWDQIAKTVGVLGTLGGGAGGEETPGGGPTGNPSFGTPMDTTPLDWQRKGNPLDYYSYGAGPEHTFFGPEGLDTSTRQQDVHLPYQPPPPQRVSKGGVLGSQEFRTGGDSGTLGQYVGSVKGPGTGRSDEIPAQLSDGEYVFDAETVALLGDGSTDAGARKLDELRERLRSHKGKKLAKGKFSDNAKDPMHYLGEV